MACYDVPADAPYLPRHYIPDGAGSYRLSSLMESMQWRIAHGHRDFRDGGSIVAQTRVSEFVSVSTVFLSLDHSWTRDHTEPLVFETMIFGGLHDSDSYRYSTLAEAEAGHLLAVEMAKHAGH